MTTLYDTSIEVDTTEAERLLRRPAKQVRNLWRAGLLKGRKVALRPGPRIGHRWRRRPRRASSGW